MSLPSLDTILADYKFREVKRLTEQEFTALQAYAKHCAGKIKKLEVEKEKILALWAVWEKALYIDSTEKLSREELDQASASIEVKVDGLANSAKALKYEIEEIKRICPNALTAFSPYDSIAPAEVDLEFDQLICEHRERQERQLHANGG